MSLEEIRSFSAALSMKYRVVIFLAVALLAPGVSMLWASADVGAQVGEVKVVTPETVLDATMAAALTNVADATHALLESQARLAGQDAEYGRLLNDLRSINSNVVVRRAELDLLFKSKSAWLEAEKSRSAAFAFLLQARQNEQALHRQLTSQEASSGATPAGQKNPSEQAWIASVNARQQAQTSLDQAEQGLLRVQHQLSYEDSDCMRLHADIKRMESDLLRVRQAKAVREKLDAAWRAADAKRRQAYASLKEAQLQVSVARQELENVDGKTDRMQAVDAENP